MQRKDHKEYAKRATALLAVGLGLLLLGASWAEPSHPTVALTPGPDTGKELFVKTCAACHGQDARGLSGLGKDLVDGDFARQLSDEELVAFIERGRPADDSLNTTGVPMPSKGGNAALTREDLKAVVAYLRSLQKQ